MNGGVSGYEYGITCPECCYRTRLGAGDDPSDEFECGIPGFEEGCGRTLTVTVEVVDDGGDER